jgi:hypothetical protein
MSVSHLFSPRILALAALAVAGLLSAGTAIAAAEDASPDCPPSPSVQPFLPWGDTGHYLLVSGGSFEGDMSGWSLSGATVVSGNETFFVNDPTDAHSLALPRGSSAVSNAVCITSGSSDLRFFVANAGALSSKLRIEVVYTAANGQERSAKVAELEAGASWALSPQISALDPVDSLVDENGFAWVKVAFRSVGANGDWKIDDLYVDPLKGQRHHP